MDGVAPDRMRGLLGTAFIGYGSLTLAAWAYATMTASLRSPMLAAIALPCGAFALLAGALLRRGSTWARPVLVAWALSLAVLNALAFGWPGQFGQ